MSVFDAINITNTRLKKIVDKVSTRIRISVAEADYLYKNASLPLIGTLANNIKESYFGKQVSYIKNIHIEYTNLCVNKCAFCSFRSNSADDVFELSIDKIHALVDTHVKQGIKEVHIVGGIHPEKDLFFWLSVLQSIKDRHPGLHIKAFTAVELDYMIRKTNLAIPQALQMLKENGLDSIPGGGAEIFDETLRSQLFPDKIDSKRWLYIHREAHKIGLPSNATMLYGHIEKISHRLAHLEILRKLQDDTKGFNAFIPLKYKNKANDLKDVGETSLLEDLKMFAISRLFLDNFLHIKAYWPMLGKDRALLATDFGADDIDGTINDTTSIYTRAGSSEKKPKMTAEEIKELLTAYRKVAVERDALYNCMIKKNY